MLARWQFNTLIALGVLSLVLTAVNATLFTINREAQAELAAVTGGCSTSLRSRA